MNPSFGRKRFAPLWCGSECGAKTSFNPRAKGKIAAPKETPPCARNESPT